MKSKKVIASRHAVARWNDIKTVTSHSPASIAAVYLWPLLLLSFVISPIGLAHESSSGVNVVSESERKSSSSFSSCLIERIPLPYSNVKTHLSPSKNRFGICQDVEDRSG
jgi:hypothetical protein